MHNRLRLHVASCPHGCEHFHAGGNPEEALSRGARLGPGCATPLCFGVACDAMFYLGQTARPQPEPWATFSGGSVWSELCTETQSESSVRRRPVVTARTLSLGLGESWGSEGVNGWEREGQTRTNDEIGGCLNQKY